MKIGCNIFTLLLLLLPCFMTPLSGSVIERTKTNAVVGGLAHKEVVSVGVKGHNKPEKHYQEHQHYKVRVPQMDSSTMTSHSEVAESLSPETSSFSTGTEEVTTTMETESSSAEMPSTSATTLLVKNCMFNEENGRTDCIDDSYDGSDNGVEELKEKTDHLQDRHDYDGMTRREAMERHRIGLLKHQLEVERHQLMVKAHELKVKEYELKVKEHDLSLKEHQLKMKENELETEEQQVDVEEEAKKDKYNKENSTMCSYPSQETTESPTTTDDTDTIETSTEAVMNPTNFDETKSTEAFEMYEEEVVDDVVTATDALGLAVSENSDKINMEEEVEEMSTNEEESTLTGTETTEVTVDPTADIVMNTTMPQSDTYSRPTCKIRTRCYSDDDCNGGKCVGRDVGTCNCKACRNYRSCKSDRGCGGLKGACNMKIRRCDCQSAYKTQHVGFNNYIKVLAEYCFTQVCDGETDTCRGLPCVSGRCSC